MAGGFGWIVVIGSCLIHVVADGVTYSFGALLPILLDVFGEGEAATGAVGSTLFGVTLVIGKSHLFGRHLEAYFSRCLWVDWFLIQ